MTITPHAEDRRCAHPGCITVLCRYNEGPDCYAHGHVEPLSRLEMERIAYDQFMRQLNPTERIAA